MIFLLIFLKASLFAQSATHISTLQGLTTNDLTVAIKDHNNYMWLGSYNGLHKHEGSRIRVYNKIGKDSVSMSGNEMHTLFEDRQGCIWAGTVAGLDKLDPVTGFITHYTLNSGNKDAPSVGYIVSITQDKYDSIWVSTFVGFFRLDYKTGNYVKIKTSDKDGSGVPLCNTGYRPGITTDKGIWFATGRGIIFYDYNKHEFYHQFNNPLHKPIFYLYNHGDKEYGSDICSDKSRNLFFVLRDTLLIRFNYHSEKIDSFSIPFPKGAWKCCYSVVVDGHNNIWIGFRHGGILIFNFKTQQFSPIINDEHNHLLSSNYVYSICKDYRGNMWVSTNNGLDIIDYYNTGITEYSLSDKPGYLDLKYESGMISYHDGKLHIPFHGNGIFNFDTKSNQSSFFALDANEYKSIRYVLEDDKGRELVVSKNKLNKVVFSKNLFSISPFNSVINTVLQNEKCNIICHVAVNGYQVYKCTNHKIYVVANDSLFDVLAGDGFMKEVSVAYDKKRLWYLTSSELLVAYDPANKKADTIRIGKACDKIGFAFTMPRDILEDNNNNVWVTSQNGLIKYDLQQKKIYAFNTNDNLSHNFSYALALDKTGAVWVASLGGIDRYNKKNNTFKNVIVFPSSNYMNSYGSSIYGIDSLIYFLAGNKLYKINSAEFDDIPPIQSILAVNEITVNGKSLLFDTAFKKQKFNYTQNRFEFKFGLLDFTRQKQVAYYYFMEGLDKDWIFAGNKSEAVYNAIQPGNYIFHIKAIDAAGEEIKNQISIPFEITPPFWKNKLFYALVLLLTGCGIYFFIRWREKRINARQAEKIKLQVLTNEQLNRQLELEKITTYFSSSLINKNAVDDVLWDVAKNLIGRLGFEDCMIYLWNDDKTKMTQRAGHGPKGTFEDIANSHFDVAPGQGLVGYVIQTKKPVLIPDTTKDTRYRVDDINRLSEITVPIIYDDELLGVIDSEHHEKDFFTPQHMQILSTIAGMMGNKIKSIEAEKSLTQAKIEMLGINEKFSAAKLEALRSQMNPHFIFNSLNAIQECILTNKVDAAYEYLSKFSKLQRMVLNNSAKEFITLSSEIEMLKLYLSLESLRFSQSFTYTIEIEQNTDTDDIRLPSMLIQPYVENSIWHGLRNNVGDKNLKINCIEKAGELIITIDDNGVGREKAAFIKKQKLGTGQVESRGTILTEERINILSLKYNAKIIVETIDKLDDFNEPAGTTIIITLPVDIESQK